jgi:hypothetical protein
MQNPHHDQKRGCGGPVVAILAVLGLIFLGCLIFVGGCMGLMFLG